MIRMPVAGHVAKRQRFIDCPLNLASYLRQSAVISGYDKQTHFNPRVLSQCKYSSQVANLAVAVATDPVTTSTARGTTRSSSRLLINRPSTRTNGYSPSAAVR